MKISYAMFYLLSMGLFGCTTNHNPNNIPKPPQNINGNNAISVTKPVVTPAPNKVIASSPIYSNESSQNDTTVPFKRIEEQRGNGGAVTSIKINNKGNIPNYYIYPNQQPNQNVNDPQRNISSPTWQLSW